MVELCAEGRYSRVSPGASRAGSFSPTAFDSGPCSFLSSVVLVGALVRVETPYSSYGFCTSACARKKKASPRDPEPDARARLPVAGRAPAPRGGLAWRGQVQANERRLCPRAAWHDAPRSAALDAAFLVPGSGPVPVRFPVRSGPHISAETSQISQTKSSLRVQTSGEKPRVSKTTCTSRKTHKKLTRARAELQRAEAWSLTGLRASADRRRRR